MTLLIDAPSSSQTAPALTASAVNVRPAQTSPPPDLPTLIRLLPTSAQRFIAPRLIRRKVAAGEQLAAIADKCDALWFIDEGLIDVSGPPTGPIMPGAAGPLLRRGDHYGSHAIDASATHTVTLTALCDTTLLELSGDALRAACEQFDAVETWINAVLQRRPLANILRRLADEMPGDEHHLLALAE